MSAWEQMEQLIADAKAGRFNQPPPKRLTPFEEIKAKALQNPEFQAEYERLRPEFEQAQADISQKKPVQRQASGQREHLMDYIPPKRNGKNPLYAAVMFARELMREGQSPAYANGWAAKKYRVKKSDVAHYTGQVGGTVSGRRR